MVIFFQIKQTFVSRVTLSRTHIQLRAKQTAHLVNKHYQNELTLTGQNLTLKYYQPLEILTHFTKMV